MNIEIFDRVHSPNETKLTRNRVLKLFSKRFSNLLILGCFYEKVAASEHMRFCSSNKDLL